MVYGIINITALKNNRNVYITYLVKCSVEYYEILKIKVLRSPGFAATRFYLYITDGEMNLSKEKQIKSQEVAIASGWR